MVSSERSMSEKHTSTTGRRRRKVLVGLACLLGVVALATPTLAAGGPVIFAGTARDVEDGDLTNRIVWTSSLDGRIGDGGLVHKQLTTGTHTVTASVTDSAGNARSAQVTIRVGP